MALSLRTRVTTSRSSVECPSRRASRCRARTLPQPFPRPLPTALTLPSLPRGRYGEHTQGSSLLTFGFATTDQLASVSLRLAVDPADPFAAEKRAVLQSACEEPESYFVLHGRGTSAARSSEGRLSPELLQLLRLLSLPPAEASKLLSGSRPTPDHLGSGDAPVVSADGIDVWQRLSAPTVASIERAAHARLLRECRRMLRAQEGALNAPVTAAFHAPLACVRAASIVRRGEVRVLHDIIRQTIETKAAKSEAR